MYKICEQCGAHLDHGETCDCCRSSAEAQELIVVKQIPIIEEYFKAKGDEHDE